MMTSPCEALPRDEKTRQTAEPLYDRLIPATRDDLLRIEAGATAQAIHAAIDDGAKPVEIRFAGGTIHARPLDTRRFVRAMSRFVSFN
jgi:hypothetical protein